jgi:hypothetical protein
LDAGAGPTRDCGFCMTIPSGCAAAVQSLNQDDSSSSSTK